MNKYSQYNEEIFLMDYFEDRSGIVVEIGVDQDFLGQVIYPYVKNKSLEHSEFRGDIKFFPTVRNNFEFVGDVFDENDIRHPDYWKLIKI